MIGSYIDDIQMDESVVVAEEIVKHLKKFGPTTKPSETIEGGTPLGFKFERDKMGKLVFH